MKTKVKFKSVYKTFELHAKKSEKILNLFSMSKKKGKEFLALKDISFEIFEGETVGLVGLNGSGKSTVSNILAGVIQPSTGHVEINGETSLIAISAGLNGSLTGIENIELKCMMHGLTKEKIKEITPTIVEFADIGNYINQPVKDYSSGMKSRLGFAISVHTDPDILIIDEALSVGDSTFTQKCLNKMDEFKEQGKTIVFISHSAGQMKEFCDRVIWLHYGTVKETGSSTEVVENYQNFTKWFNKLSDADKRAHKQEMISTQVSEQVEKESKRNHRPIFNINFLKNIVVLTPVIVLGVLMLTSY
ncbi:ABC transporter ATP-binding protein [Salinibacillus xinjiangensis]|uniref:ATP-binding cassette domain-containing protein n=1 Tax=Salinibacillus xinjiangensis TaxID=1229268 RepID=A0A6G1X2C2_9BACI|nr:ATP-binding cassette domain-containing protein [Salinibacillus xinjiangensis]MRG85084.1 ATP-binding cassette domain-containing protein [Salinibacillus xinjiangensis]